MEFKVFTVSDEEWKTTLESFPGELKDVYYLPQWFQTWTDHEKAEAFCIYFETEGIKFLYPFFRKKITNYDLNAEYYDIQSAYGYGGVIANSHQVPEEIEKQFNSLVSEWLYDNKVIAEFIRENPLIKNVSRDAEYSSVRQNVYIETGDSYKIPDKQARQNVAKALSADLSVRYDYNLDNIDEFINLYKLTQQRLNMHPYYDFDCSYFYKFKELLASYATLIHIVKDDQIIAGGLYIKHLEKASLHLAASKVEYQILRSNDLLYAATIELSMKNGVSILNVGGGMTNDLNDTLFRFKKKYSSNIKEVRVGKIIHNKEVYDKLTKDWESNHPELKIKYHHYFLKYHQQV